MLRKLDRHLNLAALCLLLLTSLSLAAAGPHHTLIRSPEPGWPQWRGPYRDGISDETGLLQQWPASGPHLLWKIENLGHGWSSPVITRGKIFITGDIGDDLTVFAFDTDANLLWKTTNGNSWKRSYPGARACCVFSEDRLYNLNAHGRLACIDPASGKELWSLNILDRFDAKNITWAISECLLVDRNNLIVTPGGKKALLAALDKRTGSTVWTTPALENDAASHSSPIIFTFAHRRIIATCSSAHGFAVDADTGSLLFTVPLKNDYGTNISTPILGFDCLYFVTPYAELGRLYRLTADSGDISAKHLWTCPLDTVTGAGVLIGDTLCSAGYKTSKWWFAIDWKTGKTRYELKDLTTGSAICADNRLYCLDEKGTVALLELTDTGFATRGRFSIETGRYKDAWTHPVLLDGCLYIRQHETLYCYDVKAP
jgi:hypothetical protein